MRVDSLIIMGCYHLTTEFLSHGMYSSIIVVNMQNLFFGTRCGHGDTLRSCLSMDNTFLSKLLRISTATLCQSVTHGKEA